jgi:hypothetical protein
LISSWHSSCGFLSLELFITGQQCLHASRARGLDSLVCHTWAGHVALLFELWILVPRIVLWLPTPFYHPSHGFRSFDPLFFWSAVPQIHPNNGFFYSSHQCRYCTQPWASVPRLSLIQGRQCLYFDSGVNFGSLEFNSMLILMLTLNARILVAIYQFGYCMSSTKVSP